MSAHWKKFEGKTCTILTSPVNRQFTESQWVDYFVGRVETIDARGVLLSHLVTGKLSFFYHDWITAIVEEITLNPDDPEEAKVIAELKDGYTEKPPVAPQQPSPPKPQPAAPPADYQEQQVNGSPFMDVNSLANLAKRAKEKMKK